MSLNKVMIIGRLGQETELKYTPSGSAVCNFSVATSEKWNDKTTGQKQEKTEWHKIVVWGKLAELCHQYLNKGSQAFIEGKLQTRSWEDKDGYKRYTVEINATTVQFLDAKPSTDKPQQSLPTNEKPKDYEVQTNANFANDEIPF